MRNIYSSNLKIIIALWIMLLPFADAEPVGDWPYWSAYQKTPLADIRPQPWVDKDHTIDGWDWSLPADVKPAANGLLAIYRTSNIKHPLNDEIKALDLPINQTLELWIKWNDLEPNEGDYRFDLLRKRMEEAEQRRCFVVLRILSSATIFAPTWLEKYQIPHVAEDTKKKAKVTNYVVSHPEFHKRYLQLVHKLGESGIPQMAVLKGAYVGYASPSYGDEGIGPHGEDPDKIPHVIERLDAWARAFAKQEQKVFMGGISKYGFAKGFGTRRGFVEMFLYHIPDPEIGQTVDKDGYLYVDDSVELLKRRAFHGEENEEYEERWATEEGGYRFGKNTDSFPYRYFVANLRTLQMQCNHVLMNPFSLDPHQMVWMGQTLGRTVEDAPDIWCAMRESYLRNPSTVKNMERWLYQRDSAGFETVPDVKINHPIRLWMVKKDHDYDFIARRGKKIGLAIDDRWCADRPTNVAVKTSYFDRGKGSMDLIVTTSEGKVTKKIPLTDTGKLMTATTRINAAVFSAKKMDFDIIYEAHDAEAVLSFVRVIRLP